MLGLAVGVALALGWERYSLRKATELRERERQEADKAIAGAKREIDALARQTFEYGEVFQFLPEQIRDLLIAPGARPVGTLALALIERLLHPEQAAVFVARPVKGRIALASASGLPSHLAVGAEVPIGRGRLGYVAQARVTLDETDFQSARGEASAKVAERIRHLEDSGLRGFKVEAAAPIVNGPELLGVLAVGGARTRRGHEKRLLALVAELAAVAFLQAGRLKGAEEAGRLDGLTSVFSKPYLDERLRDELVAAQRDGKPLSVLLLDVDYLEQFNRTNGHLAGDEMLRQLMALVKGEVRDTDVVARVGGEEFVVVYPGASKEAAMRLAEALRQQVEEFPFAHRGHQPLGAVTFSGGVATFPEDAQTGERLIHVAEQAMREAKEAGRNRVFPGEPSYIA